MLVYIDRSGCTWLFVSFLHPSLERGLKYLSSTINVVIVTRVKYNSRAPGSVRDRIAPGNAMWWFELSRWFRLNNRFSLCRISTRSPSKVSKVNHYDCSGTMKSRPAYSYAALILDLTLISPRPTRAIRKCCLSILEGVARSWVDSLAHSPVLFVIHRCCVPRTATVTAMSSPTRISANFFRVGRHRAVYPCNLIISSFVVYTVKSIVFACSY